MYKQNQSNVHQASRMLQETGYEQVGRHRRIPDDRPSSPDRWEERITANEQCLHDLCRDLLAKGADPDVVVPVFAATQDLLAEARICSAMTRRELGLAKYEHDQVHKRLLAASTDAVDGSQQVVPDIHGLGRCPDPSGARTPTEFVNVLRMYHVWAGKPSYRVMQRRIDKRFGASTLHNALHNDKMPSMVMVESIIQACDGTADHQQMYARAWRSIAMAAQSASERAAEPATKPRALYSVSQPA